MNADELRGGLGRLAIILAVLVALCLLAAAGFALAGAPARAALSAGTGVVGIFLVVFGIGASMKASPLHAHRASQRGNEVMSPVDAQRDAERLAMGLFVLGILLSLVALLVRGSSV